LSARNRKDRDGEILESLREQQKRKKMVEESGAAKASPRTATPDK